MDINVGWNKVLRVRWLRATPERKHIWGPKIETRSALLVRHEKALEAMEDRRLLRLEGADTSKLDAFIKNLGYVVEDEPTAEDGRYSYWRKP